MNESYNAIDNNKSEINANKNLAANNTSNDAIPDNRMYPDAPYYYNHTDSESVSLSSGALTLNSVDLRLPGKNGFDLVLQRIYDSSDANPFKVNIQKAANCYFAFICGKKNRNWELFSWKGPYRDFDSMQKAGEEELKEVRKTSDAQGYDLMVGKPSIDDISEELLNEIAEIECKNSQGGYSQGYKDNSHFTNLYGLGHGWRFNLPSIEIVPDPFIKKQVRYYGCLHVGDGRIFRIGEDFDKLMDSNEKTYSLSDVSFAKDGSGYIVTYKDGKRAYFNEHYILKHIKDRYDNQISYEFTDGRLSKITDTFGRELTLNWEDLPNIGHKIRIDMGGTTLYTYTVHHISEGNQTGYQLRLATDAVERSISYQYESASASEQNFPLKWEDPSSVKYYNLKQLTHTSGAKSHYEYQKILFEGHHSNIERFALHIRYDKNADIEINREEYSFTPSYSYEGIPVKYDYQGYYDDYDDYDDLIYVDIKCPYVSKTTHTTLKQVDSTLNKLITTYLFSEKQQKISSEQIFFSSTTQQETLLQHTDYEYNVTIPNVSNDSVKNLPSKETTKVFDPSDPTHFTISKKNYVYNRYGNVNDIIEEHQNSDGHIISRETNLTYTDSSQILTKITDYSADPKLRIKEVNTYDGPRLTKSQVFEVSGDTETVKSTVNYAYDYAAPYHNCVSTQTTYTTPYENAESKIVTHFEYGSNSPEPTEKRIEGVRDASGALIDSTHGAGVVKEKTEYNVYGLPTDKYDANNHRTQYEYDTIGRVTKEHYAEAEYDIIGDAVPKQVKFKSTSYDDAANTVTVTDENSKKWLYKYTPLGQLEYESVQDHTIKMYTYDENNRLKTEKMCGELTFIINSIQPMTTIRPPLPTRGRTKSTTTYTYDHFDRVTAKTIDEGTTRLQHETIAYDDYLLTKTHTLIGDSHAESIVTVTTTDMLGRVVSENVSGAVTRYEYDLHDKPWKQVDPMNRETLFTYDHAGRVLTETRPYREGAQNLSIFIQNIYDALGNKKESQDYNGNKTKYDYDDAGRLIRQAAPFDVKNGRTRYSVILYYYDAAGNTKLQRVLTSDSETVNPVWRDTGYTYDARNRQTAVYQFRDQAAPGTPFTSRAFERTRYAYDGVGNKTQVAVGPAGDTRVTTYTCDPFGNVLSMTDPMQGSERYTYDWDGVLMTKTDRNGVVTTHSYDGLNRVTKETNDRDGEAKARVTSYTLTGQKKTESQDGLAITYWYNNRGLLKAQTDPGGIEKGYSYWDDGARQIFSAKKDGQEQIRLLYRYNSLGRLINVMRNGFITDRGIFGDSIARYGYDYNGNRTSLSTSENAMYGSPTLITSYDYNFANLVTKLTNAADDVWDYSYYTDGNQRTKTHGGKTSTYTYDFAGRLESEDNDGFERIAYQYDAFSNRTVMIVTDKNDSTMSYTTTYDYDKRNRLTMETKEFTTTSKGKDIYTYVYDDNGNQIYREWEGFKPSGERDNPGKIRFLRKDEAGLAILEERRYNGFNQLVSVSADGIETGYTYRPDGLRHEKKLRRGHIGETATIHHWDGQDIVMESNGLNGHIRARYFRGIGLICRQVDGNVFYYRHNAHGDVVRTQNIGPSGNWGIEKVYHYDAFGNERGFTGQEITDPDPNPFRYCGEYFDFETGEYYLRARGYCPRTGRFGCEDSARDGLNWYSYCYNSPIKYSDPTGNLAYISAINNGDDGVRYFYNGKMRVETRMNYLYGTHPVGIAVDALVGLFDDREIIDSNVFMELGLEVPSHMRAREALNDYIAVFGNTGTIMDIAGRITKSSRLDLYSKISPWAELFVKEYEISRYSSIDAIDMIIDFEFYEEMISDSKDILLQKYLTVFGELSEMFDDGLLEIEFDMLGNYKTEYRSPKPMYQLSKKDRTRIKEKLREFDK